MFLVLKICQQSYQIPPNRASRTRCRSRVAMFLYNNFLSKMFEMGG